MVKSMTGYSRLRREEVGFSLSVCVKATNHRFLDVQVGVTAETLEQLNEMRAREGEALERDMRSRLDRLQELSRDVATLSDRVSQLYQGRLESRLRDMLASVEVDPTRLAQEVAYLASH